MRDTPKWMTLPLADRRRITAALKPPTEALGHAWDTKARRWFMEKLYMGATVDQAIDDELQYLEEITQLWEARRKRWKASREFREAEWEAQKAAWRAKQRLESGGKTWQH